MTSKGFAETQTSIDTPNDISIAEKPLKNPLIKTGRVDINELKAKLQATESKEFKKNISILSILVLALGIIGIYLSL
tara:strand:+ start:177 stop:407 length:231 start_codon:yes stop_codon:yes gene_type:complete